MWAPVPRALQECAATASRRAEPRAWLGAVEWLVEAGLHRRAGATTLAVARDLAGRMDYRLGRVLYDLDGTAERCGVSTSTVKRHVRVLRELGALVWQRHGSKRNLRLPGRSYAGTATIYAAVIPTVFDQAMGYRLDGTGYEARVVGVTEEGRARAVKAVRAEAHARDDVPVDNRSSGPRAPHSLRAHSNGHQVDVSGELNYTSREGARSNTASTRPGGTAGRGGRGRSRRASRTSAPTRSTAPKRSARQVARDIGIARQVRPLVAWTQREGLRRLAYALRPLIDRGLGAHDIAAELHAWWLDWRPARPAAFIAAELKRRGGRDRSAGHAGTGPSEAFSRAVADLRLPGAGDGGPPTAPVAADGPAGGVEGLAPTEVIELRSAAAADSGLILAALENLGERDTRRLYTNRLVDQVLLREFGGTHLQLSRDQ